MPALGYETAAIGKWHLADQTNGAIEHPNLAGFDHYTGSVRTGGVESYFAWSKVTNGEITDGKAGWADSDKVDDAIVWLDQRSGDQPWLLWMAFNAPHTPFHLPPLHLLNSDARNLDPDAINNENQHAYYNAMIEALDTEIGRLLAHLSEAQRANTYIVFVGDNGTPEQVAMPPFDFTHSKGSISQGGVNVPFFVVGPGIDNGRVSKALANSVDIYATLVELAGIDSDAILPSDKVFDTVSLTPVLFGDSDAVRDYAYVDVFGSVPRGVRGERNRKTVSERAIRDQRYKLFTSSDREEFYDLTSDPFEKNNLLNSELTGVAAQSYAQLTAQLAELVASEESAVHSQAKNVLYVDASASGGDGSSWTEAFADVQAALLSAKAGDEVWVAAGNYYPTADEDRAASFLMVDGVDMYGGFAGGETSLEQRDWAQNLTILSGNIGARDVQTDNSLTVVKGADSAIIDGFVIEDGYAVQRRGGQRRGHITPEIVMNASSGSGSGGGMFNHGAAPIVRNTVIRNNVAGKGGGVYNMAFSPDRAPGVNRQPVFIDVTIKGNSALGRGGGMANDLGTHPIIINSAFVGNSNIAKGGALYNDFGCSPVIVNTSFVENTAMRAAAVGNDGTSNPILVNVDMSGNVALDQGAALYQGSYNANNSAGANHPIVINSRITGNRSESHGPATIFNWGEDWITAIDSEIDDWPFSASESEASQYDSLVAAAVAVEGLSASQVSPELISELMSYVPTTEFGARPGGRSRPPGGTGQFGVDEELQTDVLIAERVFYVKAGSSEQTADGQSWQTAFTAVQEAIDAAHQAGGGQVWVAAGTYYPTESGDRSASFVMREGVGIYGGFSGDEHALDDRDWDANKTILSGDIGAQDVATDNAYHVVLGSVHGVLDGFTVRDGYADGVIKNSYGGGMFNWGYRASAIVKNTIFTSNYARDGGAIFNFGDVLAYFDSITVQDNEALTGGGMTMRFGSSIRVDDSWITDNFAEYRGGGALINYGSNAEFNNVTFSGNRTNGNGGGVWVDDQASQYGGTRPVFNQSIFRENKAGFIGGGIHNFNVTTTVMDGNIFIKNLAAVGSNVANTLNSRVIMRENTADPKTVYTDDSSSVSRE